MLKKIFMILLFNTLLFSDSLVDELSEKKEFLIVKSTTSYKEAKKYAEKISQKLEIELDLRGLTFHKRSFLTESKEICEEHWGEGGYPYDFDKTAILPLDKLKQQLFTLLNNYAQPEFLALDIELVDEVLIISVPPRGLLISLSKDLKLKNNNTDRKGTTYYRVGEDIRVASSEVVGEFERVFGSEKQSVSITIHGDVKGVVNAESGSVIHQTIS